jgi:hypothetical protein
MCFRVLLLCVPPLWIYVLNVSRASYDIPVSFVLRSIVFPVCVSVCLICCSFVRVCFPRFPLNSLCFSCGVQQIFVIRIQTITFVWSHLSTLKFDGICLPIFTLIIFGAKQCGTSYS